MGSWNVFYSRASFMDMDFFVENFSFILFHASIIFTYLP